MTLPPTQYQKANPSDMESNDPCGSCSPESGGDLPRVTKLAGGSMSLCAPSPHTPDPQLGATSSHICSPSNPQRGDPARQWDPCGVLYLKQKEGFHT